VTYYSSSFSRYRNNYDGTEQFYSYDNISSRESGTFFPFGSEVKLERSFGSTNDTATFVAAPVIILQSYTYTYYESPFTCHGYNSG
jgi:hypothetical protein